MSKVDKRKQNKGQPKKAPGAIKQPITIYETANDIALVGSLNNARTYLKKCWDEYVADLKKIQNSV